MKPNKHVHQVIISDVTSNEKDACLMYSRHQKSCPTIPCSVKH